MKSSPLLVLITALSITASSGQTLRDLFNRQHNIVAASISPVAMVELMESQLNNQFKGYATSIAQKATAKLIKNGQVMARGTVINGRDQRFSYLLCPADAVHTSGFIVQTQDGRLHRPIPGTPVQLLSRADNLALVRLPYLENAVSFKSNLRNSSVGSFVGIFAREQKWKTGVVTNPVRSAYTDIDPGTQRALSKHWDRIGLQVSKKRSGYPEVVETDLNLRPSEAGSPVFDRVGTWHGIAIARVDQHSTFVIPAKRVANLLAAFEIAHNR